jgi:hypothetical protein
MFQRTLGTDLTYPNSSAALLSVIAVGSDDGMLESVSPEQAEELMTPEYNPHPSKMKQQLFTIQGLTVLLILAVKHPELF